MPDTRSLSFTYNLPDSLRSSTFFRAKGFHGVSRTEPSALSALVKKTSAFPYTRKSSEDEKTDESGYKGSLVKHVLTEP